MGAAVRSLLRQTANNGVANHLVFLFADGTVFFVGLCLASLSAVLLFASLSRPLRSAGKVSAIAGFTLIVLSATPVPPAAYAVWGCLLTLASASRLKFSFVLRATILTAYLLVTGGLFVSEARWRLAPSLTVSSKTPVYVLGDSISAGGSKNERYWPHMLQEMTGLRVVNLAAPGARTGDALRQAENISTTSAVVIVEIGGNDLLGDTDADKFRVHLDRLMTALRAGGHKILIFELPLFPFQNAYGKVQREVSRKYGAILLPKRFFASVLKVKDNTSDGLHLSGKGHEAMAAMVARVLKPETEKTKGDEIIWFPSR